MAGTPQDDLLDGLIKTIETHGKTAIGSSLVPALVITAFNISTSHCTGIPDKTKWARGMMCFDVVTMSLHLGGLWSRKKMVELYGSGKVKLDKFGMLDGSSVVERFEASVWSSLTAGGLTEVAVKPVPGNIVFGGSTPLDQGAVPHHVGIATFDGSIANINLTPGDKLAHVTLDKFRAAFPYVYETTPTR